MTYYVVRRRDHNYVMEIVDSAPLDRTSIVAGPFHAPGDAGNWMHANELRKKRIFLWRLVGAAIAVSGVLMYLSRT